MLKVETITSNYLATKIVDKVKDILTRYPETRDSSNQLLARYYKFHCPEPVQYITGEELLNHLASGNLDKMEVVTRASRKLQQEYPELRGKLWEKRQHKETEVREEVKTWEV